MRRLVLTKAARADLREISAYTMSKFGVRQAEKLRARFKQTFDLLAAAPFLGRLDHGLAPSAKSYRAFVVIRRFILVYDATQEDGIVVIRVLHGMQDLATHLRRPLND